MLKWCGLALCALAALMLMRSQRSEFAWAISFAAAAILFGAGLMRLSPALSRLAERLESTEFGGYVSVLARALGITLAVQFTAELCRDAGEGALASKLELIGKAELLLLALPLVEELAELAVSLVGGGG